MDGSREGVCVGVDKLPGTRIVEGNLSLVYVHKDANPMGLAGQIQWCGLVSAEGILILVAQAEEPVAICGADHDLSLAVDGVAGYTQVPVCLAPHIHLPVVLAGGESLHGQETDDAVEALRTVGHRLGMFTAVNLLVVGGEDQPWVSGGRVKGHIFWV